MDVLVKEKGSNNQPKLMSVDVYGLLGGEAVFEIIDSEGTETWANRGVPSAENDSSKTLQTAIAEASLRNKPVVVGQSTTVQTGKLPPVAATNHFTDPFGLTGKNDEVVSATPGVKAISLEELQASEAEGQTDATGKTAPGAGVASEAEGQTAPGK